MRILSIDPGTRKPGIAVVQVWWDRGGEDPWPRYNLEVLLGDPIIPSTIPNAITFGVFRSVPYFDQFFRAHAETLFADPIDFIVVEQPHGQKGRFAPLCSLAVYGMLQAGQERYGIRGDPTITMCSSKWKTAGLGVEAGDEHYDKRKDACVEQTEWLLQRNGMVQTAQQVRGHVARNDISDAFMQALQFFMHHPVSKREIARRRPLYAAWEVEKDELLAHDVSDSDDDGVQSADLDAPMCVDDAVSTEPTSP